MAASALGTRISKWCFVAFLSALGSSSSEASRPAEDLGPEIAVASSDELYLVVELATQRLSVRARGVELSSWPSARVALLARRDVELTLPISAVWKDWPAPRTRNFHVIPGSGGGGQPATEPAELPHRWGGELETTDAQIWTFSVNDERSLLSRTGRLWEALRPGSRERSEQPVVALELPESDARGLYHLARPNRRVLIYDRAPAALVVQLPAVPVTGENSLSPAGSGVEAAAAQGWRAQLGRHPWLLVLVGFAALLLGGELLVRGAVRIATAVKLSTLVIGLTVVAYGTSAPELAVTLRSGLAGAGDLGLGNVVGSNIFNILVILGLSALVQVLVADPHLVRRDVTTMIGFSLALGVMSMDGLISRLDGLILLVFGTAYTVFLVRSSARPAAENPDQPAAPMGPREIGVAVALAGLGIVALVIGAGWLVQGASTLATSFGVSDLVVGLTIVAAGTSLPELATSAVAAFKGERDIAVGNVIGSNIFNICWVLGLGAVVTQGFVVASHARTTDVPMMIAVAILIWPLLRSGHRLVRFEAVLLIAVYLLYLGELWGRSVA